MARATSAEGRDLLASREGCRLKAYQDSAGVWTIGVGHTGRAAPPPVTAGMTISQAAADAIFAADLAPFEAAVDRALTRPPTQNQFDAMVSLAFNIGANGFAGSTVVHKFNAGDLAGAADAFLMWVHPPELRRRRIAERAQFLTLCGAPASPRPLPKAPSLDPVPPPSFPTFAPARKGFWARFWAALTGKAA